MLKFANYCIRIWNNQCRVKITRITKLINLEIWSWCLTKLTELRILEYQKKKESLNISKIEFIFGTIFFGQKVLNGLYINYVFLHFISIWGFIDHLQIRSFQYIWSLSFRGRVFLKLSLSFTTVFDLNIKHLFSWFSAGVTPSNCCLACKFKQLKFEAAYPESTHC